jgi:putative ABC transport system permease protein
VTWRKQLRFWRSNVREDVDDEIRFHFEMRVRDLVAAGWTEAAAREEAAQRFGELAAVRDACIAIDTRRRERVERREVMGNMKQDLRFAFRTLLKSPGFTLMAVLCIGLGVGVTSTILSAVNAILIRPLPYQNPEELVAVYAWAPATGERRVNISHPDYLSWRDDNRTLAQLGMWTWDVLAFSGDGEPERLNGAMVTANLFPLLGVQPLIGRGFTPEEEQPNGPRVILLGHALWQRRYGGQRDLVGKTITVNGFPTQVIGVMPQGFAFPDRGNAWRPLVVDDMGRVRGNRFFAGAIGRMRPGVTVEQARQDLDVISTRLEKEYEKDNAGWRAETVPLREDLVGEMRRPLLIFLGAVGCVLLIVCANVANLMLTRGAGRQREIAVRAAIGADRGRLVRQLVTESLVLAFLGGVVGLAIAAVGVKLYGQAVPSGLPWYISLKLDGTTLLATFGLSALTGVLFGVVPAFRSTAVNLTGALREGSTGAGEGRGKHRLRGTLVVAEVALSVVLMIGAGLLLRSYAALQGTTLGFDRAEVLSFRLALPQLKYDSQDKRRNFYANLFDRIETIPGVEAAGAAQGIPFSGWNVKAYLSIEGQPARPRGQELDAHYQRITPDFFTALGIRILKGRGITAADRDTANPVTVINETLAKQAFPGQDPIGRRIKRGDPTDPEPWFTVIGVAPDFRHYRLPEPMGPAMYLAFNEVPGYTMTVVVRTAESVSDPMSLAPRVLGMLKELDSDIPAYEVQTLEMAVDRSLWRQRLQGQVIGLFAALGMILAAIGIYGVISYGVAQRTREVGVRMALGASRSQVVGLVLRQGMLLVGVGLVLGLVAAFGASRALTRLLYGIAPTDLVSFVGVPLVLGVVALLASWLPARRAARVDPLIAMRAD